MSYCVQTATHLQVAAQEKILTGKSVARPSVSTACVREVETFAATLKLVVSASTLISVLILDPYRLPVFSILRQQDTLQGCVSVEVV